MSQIRIAMLVLMIAMQTASLAAQSFVGPPPWFTLTISEEHQLRTPYTPEAYGLLVKYTNVSRNVQIDPCVVDPWIYSVQIVHDGLPLEKKNAQKEENGSKPESHSKGSKIHSIVIHPCTGTNRGIKPGESVKFQRPLTIEYDLTGPGKYDITVTRKVPLPRNPQRTVTIKSNTLTIAVPSQQGREATQR